MRWSVLRSRSVCLSRCSASSPRSFPRPAAATGGASGRRKCTTGGGWLADTRWTGGPRCIWSETCLSLGIAGCVALASVLDTLIFRPLPYKEAERIVTLWQHGASAGGQRGDVAPANFLDGRERARTLETLAAVVPYSFDFTGGGEPEVLFGAQVTEGFWQAMGTAPALGRPFLPEEHVRGGRRVALISPGLWRRNSARIPPSSTDRSASMATRGRTSVCCRPISRRSC